MLSALVKSMYYIFGRTIILYLVETFASADKHRNDTPAMADHSFPIGQLQVIMAITLSSETPKRFLRTETQFLRLFLRAYFLPSSHLGEKRSFPQAPSFATFHVAQLHRSSYLSTSGSCYWTVTNLPRRVQSKCM